MSKPVQAVVVVVLLFLLYLIDLGNTYSERDDDPFGGDAVGAEEQLPTALFPYLDPDRDSLVMLSANW